MLVVGGAVALSWSAACGGAIHKASPPPPTTVAPTTSTTTDPTEAAILAAYRAGWDDYLAVAEAFPVNPSDARLALHSTAKVLVFDHSIEVDGRTKMSLGNPDIGHSLNRFTMTRSNGQWYASDSTIVSSGVRGDTCIPGS